MPTETEDKNNKEYAAGYAKGRESNLLEDFLAHCPLGGCASDDSIYAKGFRAGAADGDTNGTKPAEECGNGESDEPVTSDDSSSCCYIVGACLDELRLPRNSLEMRSMQTLAREYILKTFSGRKDYVKYGKIGPAIVSSIRQNGNSRLVWEGIYSQLRQIAPKVEMKKYEEGYDQYKSMALGLEAQFVR